MFSEQKNKKQKKKKLSFFKPTENKTSSNDNPLEIKPLNRLRIDFSLLNGHEFRHNFGDALNPY